MNRFLQAFWKWSPLQRTEWGLLAAIVAVVTLTIFLDKNQVYWNNSETAAREVLRQSAMLGIFALGSAVIIISGGIDLSCGSVIAFSGSFCAVAMLVLAPEAMINDEPVGPAVVAAAIGLTLLAGFLIGSMHAFLITQVGLPPFVATLASLVGLRSVGRILVKNVTGAYYNGNGSTQINIFDDSFRELGKNVWIPAGVFCVMALAIWVLLSRTVVGRHLYAMGGNEKAAELSGIRTNRLKWMAYCIGAMLSSLAGIMYVADQSVADPQTLGRGYELNAIAAAVVGGCSLQGGVGTVPGTVFGVVFLRVAIDSVAKVIKADATAYEGLIVGMLVVLAVAFNELQQRDSKLRRYFAPRTRTSIFQAVGPLRMIFWGAVLVAVRLSH
ncbi:MAG: ABC transporter permease, partial [Planctomycetales bacterium]